LKAREADEENRTPVFSLASCGSAVELHPRDSRRDRTIDLQGFNLPLGQLSERAIVGTQRIELCLPDPKSGALTITRHPEHQQARWTASDSNREPSPCRGVALPVGASSPGPPRPDTPPVIQGGRGGSMAGQAACRYGAHAMEFSICKPVHKASKDGGNRTRTYGFGDRCSAVELRP
jgi:hypothetical protein